MNMQVDPEKPWSTQDTAVAALVVLLAAMGGFAGGIAGAMFVVFWQCQ